MRGGCRAPAAEGELLGVPGCDSHRKGTDPADATP